MTNSLPPMTIASARRLDLTDVEIVCQQFQRSGVKPFTTLDLPEATPIPAIATILKFVCSQCGSRRVVSRPGYKAPGMAKSE